MQIISMPRCSGKTMLVKIMRDMKRRERIQLIKWADELSDKDLEDAYYDAVYDCLGSESLKASATCRNCDEFLFKKGLGLAEKRLIVKYLAREVKEYADSL